MFDQLLEYDARLLEPARVAAARDAFTLLIRSASSCSEGRPADFNKANCVVNALFAFAEISPVVEPSDPDASTVTSVLTAHRGNCAALSAVVLAVADRVGLPMEAVVFPRHVMVRIPGDSEHLFELLTQGSTSSLANVRRRYLVGGLRETFVRSDDFPGYYLDNLAVRFAEAGDTSRAEAMFTAAIAAAPKLARVRFNYGTYLLGKELVPEAVKQLKRAIHFDATNAPAWANLGVAYARSGDLDAARHCFERSLRIDPRNTSARSNLAALDPHAPRSH